MIVCQKCGRNFKNVNALKKHSKQVHDDIEDIALLKKGHIPDKSKIGKEFKGKNKIVVS